MREFFLFLCTGSKDIVISVFQGNCLEISYIGSHFRRDFDHFPVTGFYNFALWVSRKKNASGGIRDWVFPVGAVQRWWHSELTKTQKSRAAKFIHEMLLQIIFMKCGPLTLKQANNECCRSILYPFSDKSFHTRLAVRALSSDQQSEQLCWGVSYLMTPHHTASRSISRPRRNRGEGITEIILCPWNMLMVTHLFQFSFGLPQDVPAEDGERPGGVHQLHGAGGEDWVSGVCVSGRVIPCLANHSDRWDLVNARLSLVNTDHVT